MATFYLPSEGGYESDTSVRYRIKVVEGNISGQTRSLTVSVEYWRIGNQSYTSAADGTCYCKIDGTEYTQTFTSSQKISYYSFTTLFSKTLSVAYDVNGDKALAVSAYSNAPGSNNITSSGYQGGTIQLSNIGKQTYTIQYKGSTNDAWGYPTAQTKTHGVALTLSTHTPARTGYTFKNWTTAQNGSGTAYAPGANYTANANVTLYAQWTINTYTVTYNANGGTGAPGNQTKTYGTALTLSSTKPTRNKYNFLGWGTSATSTTVSYAAGGSYTDNAPITLYAIWEVAYVEPRITNFTVYRCDADGNASDDGTYFKMTFNWATDETVTSIFIERKYHDASWSGSGNNISASGTSGSYSGVLGAGTVTVERGQDVRLTVSDASGSTTVTGFIPGKAYTVDFKNGGSGVAFGKPAETAGLFECDWHATFNKNMVVKEAVSLGSLEVNGQFVRPKRCVVGRNSSTAADSAWFKFASLTITAANTDCRISFKVTDSFTSRTRFGILNAYVRSHATASFDYGGLYFETNTGIDAYRFVMVHDGNQTVELWCKETGTWTLTQFDVISETSRSGFANKWSLYNDVRTSDFDAAPTSGYTQIVAINAGALVAYPVGSIVIRYDHTSPASLFGGTWTRLSPYYLYAAGSTATIGETGGSTAVTLTTANLPAHSHSLNGFTFLWGTGITDHVYIKGTQATATTTANNGLYTSNTTTTYKNTNSTGSGTAVDITPPFIKVSVWRRTA